MNFWDAVKGYMSGHGKPFDYVVLVCVIAIYLFFRAKELPFWERLFSPITSIALTWVFSDWLSDTISIPEKGAALIIMVFGVILLNIALSFVDDPAFVKKTAKAWMLKRLDISKEDMDNGG